MAAPQVAQQILNLRDAQKLVGFPFDPPKLNLYRGI